MRYDRFFAGLALASLGLGALGCNNGKDDTAEDTDTVVFDSAEDIKYLSPARAIVIASFAYDMANDTAVGFTEGTQTSNPGVSIIFFSSAWQGSLADTDNYCQANWEATPPLAKAAWTASFPALGFAFDYGSLTFKGGDCEGKLDPIDYPEFNTVVGAASWGVGIGKEMDADYKTQLSGAGTDVSNMMGGGYAGEIGQLLETNGLVTAVITTASQVNDTFIVQFDDMNAPIEMTPDEAFIEGAPQSALYVVQIVLDVSVIDALF